MSKPCAALPRSTTWQGGFAPVASPVKISAHSDVRKSNFSSANCCMYATRQFLGLLQRDIDRKNNATIDMGQLYLLTRSNCLESSHIKLSGV